MLLRSGSYRCMGSLWSRLSPLKAQTLPENHCQRSCPAVPQQPASFLLHSTWRSHPLLPFPLQILPRRPDLLQNLVLLHSRCPHLRPDLEVLLAVLSAGCIHDV